MSAILDAVTRQILEDGAGELAALGGQDVSPEERMRGLLNWLLPANDEALALERGRVMVAAESGAHFNMQAFYDTWEEKTRELIAGYMPPAVPPEREDFHIDLVRVIQNGVILSAVEHPKYWTPAKQEAFIDALMPLIRQAAAPPSGT